MLVAFPFFLFFLPQAKKRRKKERKAEKKDRKREKKERKRERKRDKKDKKDRKDKRDLRKVPSAREGHDHGASDFDPGLLPRNWKGTDPSSSLGYGPARPPPAEPRVDPLGPARPPAPLKPTIDDLGRSYAPQGLSALRMKSGGGGGGSGASHNSAVFVCATCGVECSGETSLVAHCNGKAHERRAGKKGLAGLSPNANGIVPPISPAGPVAFAFGKEAIAAFLGGGDSSGAAGGAGGGRGGNAYDMWNAYGKALEVAKKAQAGPQITKVTVTPHVDRALRDALNRASSVPMASDQRGDDEGNSNRGNKSNGGNGGGGSREGDEDLDSRRGRGHEHSASRDRPPPPRAARAGVPPLPAGAPHAAGRAALPVASYREEFLSLLAAN